MLALLCLLAIATSSLVAGVPSVLQSVPFDPFRLECAAHHGLVEMSMRLVRTPFD